MVVRTLRQQAIMRRNDLRAIIEETGKKLELLHALGPNSIVPAIARPSAPPADDRAAGPPASIAIAPGSLPGPGPSMYALVQPFALVDAVSPGSPASEACIAEGDRILVFGHLRGRQAGATGDAGAAGDDGGAAPTLADVAAVVRSHEGSPVPVVVRRAGGGEVALTLTPKTWAGPGLLGCHVMPL